MTFRQAQRLALSAAKIDDLIAALRLYESEAGASEDRRAAAAYGFLFLRVKLNAPAITAEMDADAKAGRRAHLDSFVAAINECCGYWFETLRSDIRPDAEMKMKLQRVDLRPSVKKHWPLAVAYTLCQPTGADAAMESSSFAVPPKFESSEFLRRWTRVTDPLDAYNIGTEKAHKSLSKTASADPRVQYLIAVARAQKSGKSKTERDIAAVAPKLETGSPWRIRAEAFLQTGDMKELRMFPFPSRPAGTTFTPYGAPIYPKSRPGG